MLQYDFHKNTNVFVISMNIASQHSEVCSLPVCWRGVVASVSAAGRNAAGFETGKWGCVVMLLATRGAVIRSTVITLICDIITTNTRLSCHLSSCRLVWLMQLRSSLTLLSPNSSRLPQLLLSSGKQGSDYLLHCHSAVFAVCRNIRLGDGLGSGEGVQLRGGAADRDQEAWPRPEQDRQGGRADGNLRCR